jgi:hypothetical protein
MTEKYMSGFNLFAGHWNVGGVHYDSTISKGATNRYAVTSKLPGLKGHLGNFETQEEGKLRAEQATKHWFARAYAEYERNAR